MVVSFDTVIIFYDGFDPQYFLLEFHFTLCTQHTQWYLKVWTHERYLIFEIRTDFVMHINLPIVWVASYGLIINDRIQYLYIIYIICTASYFVGRLRPLTSLVDFSWMVFMKDLMIFCWSELRAFLLHYTHYSTILTTFLANSCIILMIWSSTTSPSSRYYEKLIMSWQFSQILSDVNNRIPLDTFVGSASCRSHCRVESTWFLSTPRRGCGSSSPNSTKIGTQ